MNKAFRHFFGGRGQKMKKSLGYNLPLKPHFFHDSPRYPIRVSNIFTLFFPFLEHCAPHTSRQYFITILEWQKRDVLPCNIDLQKRRKENMNYKRMLKVNSLVYDQASNTIRVEWKLNCCFELFMEWCWIMFGVDKI